MQSPDSQPSPPLRIAIVGCGAVTKASLLPVLSGHDRIRVVALVDRDRHRAEALAAAYKISAVHTDMAVLDKRDVDAVVLATPPAHHAPATLDLVSRGFHVLVEKPMAIRAADAEAMVAGADQAGVRLSVGLYRRLLPVSRLLRGLLDAEMLGRPLEVDIEEGGEYTWELATLSVLTREGGGGGVLIDIGTHLLDQLFFLLPGKATVDRYADNARGGIETDCELRLSLSTRWGTVPARLELSRTRQLRGSIQVRCEHGTFELNRGEFCKLAVHAARTSAVDAVNGSARAIAVEAAWEDERQIVGYKAFRAEFDDWLSAIHGGRDAQLSGRSVIPVVAAIEQAYGAPGPIPESWTDQGLLAVRAPAVLKGARPRVLVTGAGGFLGCRTVECLHALGAWNVRALVRRPASAARLARLPLDIVLGDVTSRQDLARALEGCDAVVHCAVGTGWPPDAAFKVTVEGTRQTVEAALEARVRRFVHVSSMAVHGERVPARLDESAPLEEGTGASYSRAKYLAERIVTEAAGRGLNAISLRPARIYGPFSRTFTVRPLSALRTGSLVLAGDADSPANMVYVDNVVESILAALDAPDVVPGTAYLISEHGQLSWRAFFQYFADAAGVSVTIAPYPAAPAASGRGLARRWVDAGKQVAFSPELRGLAKKVLATDPIGTWPRRVWDRSPRLQDRVLSAIGVDQAVVYRAPLPPVPQTVEFRIDPTLVVFDRASSALGYAASVPPDEGMRLTLEWAKHARLL